MNIPKIKAALYSIYMYKRGFTVLRNTGDMPSTTVRAIRCHRSINPVNLDTSEHYCEITRNFDGKQPRKIKKYFTHDKYAFYNEKEKKFDYQDVVLYKKFETGKKVVKKSKGEIDYVELSDRDLSYINKVVGKKKSSVPDLTYASVGRITRKSVMVPKTFGDLIEDKFRKQGRPRKIKCEYLKPRSFWEVFESNFFKKTAD